MYTAVPYGFTFEDYGFSAVYLSFSVRVEQTDHPMILIYYFVGNVSDCGDHSSPNSAFGASGKHLINLTVLMACKTIKTINLASVS